MTTPDEQELELRQKMADAVLRGESVCYNITFPAGAVIGSDGTPLWINYCHFGESGLEVVPLRVPPDARTYRMPDYHNYTGPVRIDALDAELHDITLREQGEQP